MRKPTHPSSRGHGGLSHVPQAARRPCLHPPPMDAVERDGHTLTPSPTPRHQVWLAAHGTPADMHGHCGDQRDHVDEQAERGTRGGWWAWHVVPPPGTVSGRPCAAPGQGAGSAVSPSTTPSGGRPMPMALGAVVGSAGAASPTRGASRRTTSCHSCEAAQTRWRTHGRATASATTASVHDSSRRSSSAQERSLSRRAEIQDLVNRNDGDLRPQGDLPLPVEGAAPLV